jgi:hypothetical protein
MSPCKVSGTFKVRFRQDESEVVTICGKKEVVTICGPKYSGTGTHKGRTYGDHKNECIIIQEVNDFLFLGS